MNLFLLHDYLNVLFLTRIKVLVFMLFFATVSNGQNIHETSTTETILFKISHPQTQHISYLFGTHHAFGKAFFDSLTNANQCLSTCDVLIKENLNLPRHTAEEIINKRADLTKWKKYLRKNDFAFVEELFASSPTDYNKLTPPELYVFLNRYFTQQVCLNRSAADTSLSLDDYIGSLASQQGLVLIGLETIEEQLALVNKDVEGMPPKVHKKRLANIINKIETKSTNHCSESEWYSEMRIDYKLDEPCGNTLMLTDRNKNWMKTIQKNIARQNCFVAVGLSHFMYTCGLIRQLEELGYTVTPVAVK